MIWVNRSFLFKLAVAVTCAAGAGLAQEISHSFSWGKVSIVGQGREAQFKVSLQRNAARPLNLLETTLLGEKLTLMRPSFPAYMLYVVLPPGATARVVPGEIHWRDASSPATLAVVGYGQQSDSSALVEIYGNLSDLEVSQAAPVSLEGYEWFRGMRLARLQVSPYARGGGGTRFAEEISFRLESTGGLDAVVRREGSEDKLFNQVVRSLVVNPEGADSPVFSPLQWTDTTGEWIELNQQYLRLAIPEDGIFRLTFDDLQASVPGISSVDPRSFRMLNRGKEFPIFVAGEDDSTFEAGDYVEFVGLKNYGQGDYHLTPTGTEEYAQYLDRYTDTSVYWLTWGGVPGVRVRTLTGLPPSADTLTRYTHVTHVEQDKFIQFVGGNILEHQDPRWLPGDVWFWEFFGGPGTYSVQFNADNIDYSGTDAKVSARFSSWAAQNISPAHRVRLLLNSSDTLQALNVDRYQHVSMVGTTSIGTLVNGINTIKIHSLQTASSIQGFMFDWAEVEYPRYLRAEGDTLHFGFQGLPTTAVRVVKIGGITPGNYSIYKLGSPPRKVEVYQINSSGELIFSDTVASGDRYFLRKESKLGKPLMTLKNSFAHLRDSTRGADYVLITRRSMSGVAESYVSFVASQYGVRTMCVYVEDIFDEFGFGYPTAESVREFLKATTRWQLPMPSYVLLAGDGTYDHKFVMNSNPMTRPLNAIPPIGHPVSDPWLAVLDDASIVPQICIGRIPVNSAAEFSRYLQHHQSYVNAPNSDWNKRYMFFAGGDPNVGGQIDLFRSVNDEIIDTFVKPPPIGGLPIHFYKTTSPQSDFGPYGKEEVGAAIDNGAVFINYIGHSGTQTWDNGIGDITQLANKRNRYALISDFGCSTAKFGESDIKAFAELFTLDPAGSAIAYVGNSALGFVSVATTLPQEFYRQFLVNGIREIGKGHLLGKIELMNRTGGQAVVSNRVVMLTNTLIGDPIIQLAIPQKPNLSLKSADLRTVPQSPTDDDEYAVLEIPYVNSGRVLPDSFTINVRSTYNSISSDTSLRLLIPSFQDTAIVSFGTRRKAGEHLLQVSLNPTGSVNELTLDDNNAEYRSFVVSNAFKMLRPMPGVAEPAGEVVLLNPERISAGEGPGVIFEIDSIGTFPAPTRTTGPIGKITTRFATTGLMPGRTYYWRASLANATRPWSTGSFTTSPDTGARWTQPDSLAWSTNDFVDAAYQPGVGAFIQESSSAIRVTSSGFLDGQFGAVEINGLNALPSTFARGHTVVVMDSTDLTIQSVQSFDTFGDAAMGESLRVFLDNIPIGKFVVQLVIDEGSQGLTPAIRSSIKTLGSIYIDSLSYHDSWAIIGRKGATPGTVPEMWKRATTGKVILDTLMSRPRSRGVIVTPLIGPAGRWYDASVQWNGPPGSSIRLSILGIRENGITDTLVSQVNQYSFDLQSISSVVYPQLRLIATLQAAMDGSSPVITTWGVRLLPPPELVVNFQSITASKDTVLEGESVVLSGSVFNVGSVAAESVAVAVKSLSALGATTLATMIIPSLGVDSSASFTATLFTDGRRGAEAIITEIDSARRIAEIYRSNNFFSVPVIVLGDTVEPLVDITFDGSRILDGDYVSPDPDIVISVRDNSPLPITDPNNVILKLNSRRITLGSSPDSLFESTSGSEKARVVFRPRLPKGVHTISVQVQDASGNFADTAAQEIRFRVETASRLLNVVNVPNPISRETYFTFNLTGSQVPQELSLKIYTVGGRLVYDRMISPAELRVGFNGIFWDGRDRDGDLLANGVYFYKLAMKLDGTPTEVIEKLAIIR